MGDGTFTLTNAANYSSLNFMVATQGNNNAFTIIVRYSDETTEKIEFTNGIDWTNGATDPQIITNSGLYSNNFYNGDHYITEKSTNLDPTKQLESFTMSTTSGGHVGLLAVAGQLVIPEPSSTAFLGLTVCALILRAAANKPTNRGHRPRTSGNFS